MTTKTGIRQNEEMMEVIGQAKELHRSSLSLMMKFDMMMSMMNENIEKRSDNPMTGEHAVKLVELCTLLSFYSSGVLFVTTQIEAIEKALIEDDFMGVFGGLSGISTFAGDKNIDNAVARMDVLITEMYELLGIEIPVE